MSQDDQRNQPNEEPAEAARRAAAAAGDAGTVPGTAAGPAGTRAGAATSAGGAGAVAPTRTAARPAAAPRREFHEQGEGSPRYADTAKETPRSGSEESWSASPHPGYQADPTLHYTTKRLLVSTLIGILLLGGGATYVYRILT